MPWQEAGLAGDLEKKRSSEDTENLPSQKLFTEGRNTGVLLTAHRSYRRDCSRAEAPRGLQGFGGNVSDSAGKSRMVLKLQRI
jgi:hypothetical protein